MHTFGLRMRIIDSRRSACVNFSHLHNVTKWNIKLSWKLHFSQSSWKILSVYNVIYIIDDFWISHAIGTDWDCTIFRQWGFKWSSSKPLSWQQFGAIYTSFFPLLRSSHLLIHNISHDLTWKKGRHPIMKLQAIGGGHFHEHSSPHTPEFIHSMVVHSTNLLRHTIEKKYLRFLILFYHIFLPFFHHSSLSCTFWQHPR